MAARFTCENLITRLRAMVGDRVSPSPSAVTVWTDDELQDILDERQLKQIDITLEGVTTYGPQSLIQFLNWKAPWHNWEEDAAIKDAHYDVQSSSLYTADYIQGYWLFAVEPHYPMYLTGKTFDLFGSAADVLERWSSLKLDLYDFQDGNQSKFSRSQMFKMRQDLATVYRRKARPIIAKMVRDDVHPADELTNLKVLRR